MPLCTKRSCLVPARTVSFPRGLNIRIRAWKLIDEARQTSLYSGPSTSETLERGGMANGFVQGLLAILTWELIEREL